MQAFAFKVPDPPDLSVLCFLLALNCSSPYSTNSISLQTQVQTVKFTIVSNLNYCGPQMLNYAILA